MEPLVVALAAVLGAFEGPVVYVFGSMGAYYVALYQPPTLTVQRFDGTTILTVSNVRDVAVAPSGLCLAALQEGSPPTVHVVTREGFVLRVGLRDVEGNALTDKALRIGVSADCSRVVVTDGDHVFVVIAEWGIGEKARVFIAAYPDGLTELDRFGPFVAVSPSYVADRSGVYRLDLRVESQNGRESITGVSLSLVERLEGGVPMRILECVDGRAYVFARRLAEPVLDIIGLGGAPSASATQPIMGGVGDVDYGCGLYYADGRAVVAPFGRVELGEAPVWVSAGRGVAVAASRFHYFLFGEGTGVVVSNAPLGVSEFGDVIYVHGSGLHPLVRYRVDVPCGFSLIVGGAELRVSGPGTYLLPLFFNADRVGPSEFLVETLRGPARLRFDCPILNISLSLPEEVEGGSASLVARPGVAVKSQCPYVVGGTVYPPNYPGFDVYPPGSRVRPLYLVRDRVVPGEGNVTLVRTRCIMRSRGGMVEIRAIEERFTVEYIEPAVVVEANSTGVLVSAVDRVRLPMVFPVRNSVFARLVGFLVGDRFVPGREVFVRFNASRVRVVPCYEPLVQPVYFGDNGAVAYNVAGWSVGGLRYACPSGVVRVTYSVSYRVVVGEPYNYIAYVPAGEAFTYNMTVVEVDNASRFVPTGYAVGQQTFNGTLIRLVVERPVTVVPIGTWFHAVRFGKYTGREGEVVFYPEGARVVVNASPPPPDGCRQYYVASISPGREFVVKGPTTVTVQIGHRFFVTVGAFSGVADPGTPLQNLYRPPQIAFVLPWLLGEWSGRFIGPDGTPTTVVTTCGVYVPEYRPWLIGYAGIGGGAAAAVAVLVKRRRRRIVTLESI